MAQLGRLYYVVQDNAGTAQSGVSVLVTKQGANISGGGSGTAGPGTVVINVDNPGGIINSDTVIQVKSGVVQTTPFTVNGVTATTISINVGGAITWTDDDQLIPTSNLPTLYKETNAGADTQANPIVTGATGEAACWTFGGFYALHLSGASIATKVIPDQYVSAEISKTNVFTEATAVGFVYDTNRTLTTAGAKIISVRNLGTEKLYIDKDGHFGATTFDGLLTVSTGGVAITGNSTLTGTLGGLTGLTVASGGASITGGLTVPTGGATITAGGLSVVAGAVSFPAASIATAALQANIVTTAPTTTLGGITDVAVITSEVDRITTAAYTFSAGNVGALINVSAPYQIETGSSDETKVIVRLYMETSAASGVYVVKAWGAFMVNENTRLTQTISFSWFEASVPTGAIRWKISDQRVDVSGTPTSCSYLGTFGNDAGTQRLARIQIIEFKK
jgi:hypothetical protein